MYVYKITCIPNGKYYIGKTTRSLRQRLSGHFNRPTNKYMRNLFKKYSRDQFKIEPLETTTDPDELVRLEQKHLDLNFNNELCLNMLDKSDKGWEEAIAKCYREWRDANPDKVRENALANGDVEAMNNWINSNPELHSKLTSEGQRKAWAKIPTENRICRNREAQVAKVPNISMFTKEGKYIRTFDSIRAIVRTHPELDRAAITRVLKGKAKQHKGYLFQYAKS